MKKTALLLIIITFGVFANTEWQEDVQQWKEARVTSLKKPHGWLSLVGMDWLHKGKTSIGSAKNNDIVLSHGPNKVGDFILAGDDKVQFEPTAEAKNLLTINDKKINSKVSINKDSDGDVSVFKIDSFEFYVIQRGKPAVRIKDSQASTRLNFKGLNYFDLDPDFRVSAEFVPYEPAKDVEIVNVLGLLTKDKSPGFLKFKINNKFYQLDTLDSGDSYYLIFGDRTNGRTTYGPGRFLYVPKANEKGEIFINFHKSYNPPCAFTDYSTCPLPPSQNRLPIFIEAGEREYK